MKNTQAQRDRRAALANRNASKKQRESRARRKAMPIGLIESPLKFISAATDTVDTDRHGDKVRVESLETRDARRAANRGHGDVVRSIAYSL